MRDQSPLGAAGQQRPKGNQIINYNNQHQNRFETNYLGSNGRPRKDVTYDSSSDWMLRYHNKLFGDVSITNSGETDVVGKSRPNPYEEPVGHTNYRPTEKRKCTTSETVQFREGGQKNTSYVSPNIQSCKALYGEQNQEQIESGRYKKNQRLVFDQHYPIYERFRFKSPELRLGSQTIASRSMNGNIKNYSQVPLGSPNMIRRYHENAERLNQRFKLNSHSLSNFDLRSEVSANHNRVPSEAQLPPYVSKTMPVSPRDQEDRESTMILNAPRGGAQRQRATIDENFLQPLAHSRTQAQSPNINGWLGQSQTGLNRCQTIVNSPQNDQTFMPPAVSNGGYRREVLIDLSNLNQNLSKSFYQQNKHHSPEKGINQRSTLPNDMVDQMYEVFQQHIEDRALHKRYMEERDFANKSPFLDNFSGDPFRYVHEVKTKQRQPIKEAAKLRLSEDYSTAGGSKIILQNDQLTIDTSIFKGQIGKSNEVRNQVRKIKLDDLKATLQKQIKGNCVNKEVVQADLVVEGDAFVREDQRADRMIRQNELLRKLQIQDELKRHYEQARVEKSQDGFKRDMADYLRQQIQERRQKRLEAVKGLASPGAVAVQPAQHQGLESPSTSNARPVVSKVGQNYPQ